jgi:DNA primase large subunit
VNNIGYIGHWERFQLGIFLKKTGMNSEDQMQFWFSKAVDNVDMNYQDFKRKAGYIIRHIYGKEGGMIDYEMPSCNTIMSKMYCTFRHKDINFINEKVKHEVNRFEKNKENKLDIGKKVIEASIRVFPQIACAYFLELSNGVKADKIFHPLMYLKMAGQQSGVVVDRVENVVEVKAEVESKENDTKSEVKPEKID